MADANTAAPATETAAPNGEAPAVTPEATPSAEAKVETPESKLDGQIRRALKKGKAAAKGERPRGEGGKFAKAAKPEAAATEEPEGSATAEPPKPPPAAGKSARELLDAGDLEGAFEAAFGKKPQDFKIDSRRWEEWRKAGTRQKRELEKLHENAVADVQGKRAQLNEALDAAKKTYGPAIEGIKLFNSGDVVGAVKAVFGVDINDLQKRALSQFHGKNPEVEQLRRELAERDAAAKKRDEETARIEQERSLKANTAAYLEEIQQTLIDGSDPQLAGLATKPRFVQRVLQIQQQHYDRATRTSIPIDQAAAMARDEIVAEFGGVLGVPRDTAVTVESAQPGSKAVSSGNRKAATTSLPQRGAAEAITPGRRLTAQEQVNKYTGMARAELGLT